jgi:hypothetical protein
MVCLFIVEREYSSNAYQGTQNVEKEMNTQPEALRLAQMFDGLKFTVVGSQNALPMEEAAAELRRLHEENTALRQTIEYAKKQEHYPWCDYLNIMLTSLPPQKAKCNCKQAQPEQAEKQESVAWVYVNEDGECEQIEYGTDGCDDPDVQPLYTAPLKREWVGLTDEEIDYIWGISPPDYEKFFDFPRAIEAKLKEKNT